MVSRRGEVKGRGALVLPAAPGQGRRLPTSTSYRRRGQAAVATKAQRARFRHVLQQARADAGLSQRDLARLVEVSSGAVSQWEMGETAPRESTAAALERVLNLEPGDLGGLLGYEPGPPAGDGAVASVAEAAEADERLRPRDRRLLMALYRELVRTRDSDE